MPYGVALNETLRTCGVLMVFLDGIFVSCGVLTAHCVHAILCQRNKGPHNMNGKFIKFNVLTESRKVLKGEKTKVSEASLLHALADTYAAEHSNAKKA